MQLVSSHTDSGGETVARQLPGVRVVNAHNSGGVNMIRCRRLFGEGTIATSSRRQFNRFLEAKA